MASVGMIPKEPTRQLLAANATSAAATAGARRLNVVQNKRCEATPQMAVRAMH